MIAKSLDILKDSGQHPGPVLKLIYETFAKVVRNGGNLMEFIQLQNR